jgi:hypothetical protein
MSPVWKTVPHHIGELPWFDPIAADTVVESTTADGQILATLIGRISFSHHELHDALFWNIWDIAC